MARLNKGEAAELMYDITGVRMDPGGAAEIVLALAQYDAAEVLDFHNRARVLCGLDPLPYGPCNSEVDES